MCSLRYISVLVFQAPGQDRQQEEGGGGEDEGRAGGQAEGRRRRAKARRSEFLNCRGTRMTNVTDMIEPTERADGGRQEATPKPPSFSHRPLPSQPAPPLSPPPPPHPPVPAHISLYPSPPHHSNKWTTRRTGRTGAAGCSPESAAPAPTSRGEQASRLMLHLGSLGPPRET